MYSFERTNLWARSLGTEADGDGNLQARERIRSAFMGFREQAEAMAGEIARFLPDYTVHDIKHIDALWDTADLITGPSYPPLTPAEAFVLGGTFLIHDLGMGLVAYSNGIEELRQKAIWKDTVVSLLRRDLARQPLADELAAPSLKIQNRAMEIVLREEHARQAAQLASQQFNDRAGTDVYYLIESSRLRQTYGPIIGEVAASHGLSIDDAIKNFDGRPLGAPVGYPVTWTVDCLKIACLLRVADACQLAGRAPGFVRTLRQLTGISRFHWIFQERLLQLSLDGDRLLFTSTQPFPVAEAEPWWYCFDALQMAHHELQHVDDTLADMRRPRFAAHGIIGADAAERLSKVVRTDGWTPVDTRVKVTDVPRLVERLGGERLYGRDLTVPLRELIQNASDAVQARRLQEERPSDWGHIDVRVGTDTEGQWIEVEDTGIGMTPAVISGPLLDFGFSFWESGLMLQELPGLLAKGFHPTGRFGVGFFSIFMWGQHIKITTRPYKDAIAATQVLEFTDGLASRPVLRQAHESEMLRDGGTRVRVGLKTPLFGMGGVVSIPSGMSTPVSPQLLCAWLCPSLDVDLYVEVDDQPRSKIIAASDWKTIDGQALIQRILARGPQQDANTPDGIYAFGDNLRVLRDPQSGDVVSVAMIESPVVAKKSPRPACK